MSRSWSTEQARAARKRAGLSQREVADSIGVNVATVSQWENGHAEPAFRSAHALAALYGVSLDDFAHAPEVDKTCNGASQKITHGASTAKPDPVGNATGA